MIANPVKDQIKELLRICAIALPDDVDAALHSLAEKERDTNARRMYESMIDNTRAAMRLRRPVCQDTGVLQFFVEAGTSFPGIDVIEDAILRATAEATKEVPLRPNVVEPLGEKNTGTNTGYGAPSIHWEVVAGADTCRIRVYMAGGGCSLPGRSKVLMPLEGIDGVKRFVYEAVAEWGVNACPPLILGVGLGTCAVTSAELSKKALLRPLNVSSPDEKIRALEEEMTREVNALGIAPLGFGGSFSVLGVQIESMGHHPATLGVGLSTGCWATRRGELLVKADGSAEILSHKNAQHALKEDGCRKNEEATGQSEQAEDIA